jgi:uncharacterized protein YraI
MGIATRLRPWVGISLLVFSAATLGQNAMTTEPADLYAGPDDSYPVVAQLDPNSPIQVMGCLDDWSWCDVAAQDARGWMYAPDITYAYQGGYVPLYSYAPSLGIAVVPFSLDLYWGRYYHGRPWYSQREDWAHRTIHHRRPEGPPPHAGPPPRPEHREPVHRAEIDRHGDAGRHDNPRDDHNMANRPEAPRPAEAPRRPETHTAPAHEPPRQPAHEEHEHGAPGRAAAPAHEEHPREERPHDDHPHDDHPH